MKKVDSVYLKDILDSAELILEFYADISNFTSLTDRSLEYNAVIRRFIVIGEAVAHISEETKEKYSFIEWAAIKAFRNLIIHEYHDISLSEIEKVIQENLPKLVRDLSKIIKEVEENEAK